MKRRGYKFERARREHVEMLGKKRKGEMELSQKYLNYLNNKLTNLAMLEIYIYIYPGKTPQK